MTDIDEHTTVVKRSRAWKWLLIPLILLILAGSLRWFLQSDRLFEFVRERAVVEVNNRIDGELTVGQISGDLLFGVQIRNIEVHDAGGELLLRLDSLRLDYTIPDLIRGLKVDRLRLDGLFVEERQDEDGVWRLESLMVPAEQPDLADEPVQIPDFQLRSLELEGSSADVRSALLPDGFVTVRHLALRGGLSHDRDGWQVSLGDLRFLLDEGRLPGPVELGASASMDGEEVTLDRLLIGTGRSFLEARGFADLDGSWEAGLEFAPLSHDDLRRYGVNHLQQNLTIRIDAGGGLEQLNIQASISAEGLQQLDLTGVFQFGETLAVRDVELDLFGLNGPLLTGDDQMPEIGSLSLRSSGFLAFDEMETVDLSGRLQLTDVRTSGRHLDLADISFDWAGDRIDLDLLFGQGGERIEGAASLVEPFGDLPEWSAEIRGSELNLATWLEDPEMESLFTVWARANGTGYEFGDDPFTIQLELSDNRWGDQPLDRLYLDARVSRSTIEGDMETRLGVGELTADFRLNDWLEDPGYSFEARLSRFNLAELQGMEEFPTDLNATVVGEGYSFEPDRMQLTAQVRFDSSYVNGEPIQALRAELELDGRILSIPDALIESPVADVRASLRQNLADFRDPANWLELDGELLNPGLLAPLLGVELEAVGHFSARLYHPEETGALRFDGGVELEEIQLDSLITMNRLKATLVADLFDTPHLELDLDIDTPGMSGIEMERLLVRADSYLEEGLQRGGIAIDLRQDHEHRIDYVGEYTVREGDLDLNSLRFEIEAGERLLTLQESFVLTLSEGVLRMEPVHLTSAVDQTYLRLAIPYLGEQRQEIDLDLQRLHFGPLQQMLLGESFVDGMLSGHLNLTRSNESLESDLSLLAEEVAYQEGRMDSLRMTVQLVDERLQLELGGWHQEQELIRAHGDLPFLEGDPLAFDDVFFDQPVQGEFMVHETVLGNWIGFIPGGESFEADGQIGLEAILEGTAGQPQFEGRFLMQDGTVSGVSVERFELNFEYRHEDSLVRLDGLLRSMNSEIARYRAELPLYLDMREFSADLPNPDDEVYVQFETDRFDLALLNDLLDRDQMRNMRGFVSGQFELEGPIEQLRPSGSLELRNGNLRIVPTGITLAGISSDVTIRPGQLQLQNFQMNSGPGRFTARGDVELDGLNAGDFDLDLQAVQFRVANTPDMNAIVDLTSRLRGSQEEPVLTGNLQFRSGYVMLQNFGEQAVEDVRLEDEEEEDPFEFYENLAMEMNVSFDRQFFIRNRQYLDMEVELSGEVDLVKQHGGEMELFGVVEGLRGYARPLGRLFDLEEAEVVFSGPPDNPDLQIRTRFEPRRGDDEVVIWYVIGGTVQDPEFRFESEPYLELHDMISYTLFGQPFYALDSWQQAVSGGGSDATAADMAMDLLIDRVGTLAARQLGIDVVEIDTNRSGISGNTTIKTGWYLGDRAFFAILNEVSGTSPKTLFMLEYMLRRNLEVIVTQGDDSREGIDLRWRYDY